LCIAPRVWGLGAVVEEEEEEEEVGINKTEWDGGGGEEGRRGGFRYDRKCIWRLRANAYGACELTRPR